MQELTKLRERTERSLLIAVADLTRFTQYTKRTADTELAETVNGFYERVTSAVHAAGGVVVKFMGDAALIIFAEDKADAAVEAMLGIKVEIDRYWASLGWDAKMIVKMHVGSVIAGPFGPAGHQRFDILGSAINQTFRLDSSAFALSSAAFRKLSPDMRKRFKKHTPPVTYIRSEDRHM